MPPTWLLIVMEVAVLVLGLYAVLAVIAWAEQPGRLVPGWMSRRTSTSADAPSTATSCAPPAGASSPCDAPARGRTA